jgi:tetratricopeptide (TPR) repeat protein
MWLTMAVMHAPREHRKMMSEQLFMLPLLDSYDQKPLFEENTHVSVMLRMAQFRIAVWANMIDRLPDISDRLIAEARMIRHKDIADGQLYLVINKVLIEQSLRISPQKWMPLIGELEGLLDGQGTLIEYIRGLDVTKTGLNGLSVPQFLFAIRDSSLKSINELVELFRELDRLEEKRRSSFLSSLEAIPHGKRLMIDSAWMAETKQGNLGGVEAAAKFRQLAEIAEKWGNNDISVECEFARAVMLDEYANNSEAALASLDEAERKYPNQVRLIRQRASVYYRRGDHPTALAIIAPIADVIPREHRIDRAFALREAGISAAETGDFPSASHFFSEAFEAASNATANMWPMAVGLKGDCAFAEFKLGHHHKALQLTSDALMAADRLDPEAGPNEKYRLIALGCLILWMRSEVQGKRESGDTISFRAGMCSNLQPLDEIMNLRTSPKLRLLAWYQLAELEVELQANVGVFEELQRRTVTTKIVSCEQSLIMQVLARCIRTVDIGQFFLHLPSYVARTVYYTSNADKIRDKDICEMTVPEFPEIKAADWSKDPFLSIAKDAIVALGAIAACSDVSHFEESLLKHVDRMEYASAALKPFIECFKKVPRKANDVYELAAFCIGRLMGEEGILTPDDTFIVTFRLWNWLGQSNFRGTVENVVAEHLAERWQKIITDQRFYLMQPMMSVPPIEDALNESTKGMAKIAVIVLGVLSASLHEIILFGWYRQLWPVSSA